MIEKDYKPSHACEIYGEKIICWAEKIEQNWSGKMIEMLIVGLIKELNKLVELD